MDEAYGQAWDDLIWRWRGQGASVGAARSCSMDPDHSGGVFDDEASHRAHMARRKQSYRDDIDRRARIDFLLAVCGVDVTVTTKLGFESYGAARASYVLQTAMGRRGSCMIALGLKTRIARVAYAREFQRLDEIPPSKMLEYFENQIRTTEHGSALAKSHVLSKVADEAYETLTAAVGVYDMELQKWHDAKKQERRAAEIDGERFRLEQYRKATEKRANRTMQAAMGIVLPWRPQAESVAL